MTASETPDALPRSVVAALRGVGQTVATCESLTAGLLAATIAEIPGSSAVLRGGLVTYATELKHELAGVDPETLAEHGPVSLDTAEQMATGARDRCGADWAVSLTGVAGPEPQGAHPVGEVFVGIAGPDGTVSVARARREGRMRYTLNPAGGVPIEVLSGSRDRIRRESVHFALKEFLSRVMEQNPRPDR